MKRSYTVKMKIRCKMASCVVAASALVALPSISTANGLQQQMNRLFDSMTNTTQPGVYETQRRGVIAGGRFTMKNKVYRESIFHITPPSINAGCGGIDFFGGSFSFINSEQLTQLMRAIAANAAGYAFKIALTTMCEMCMTHIETLAKKLQELNQYMGNSCQLAQGIVNDLTSGFDLKGRTDESLVANAKGLFSDFFDAVKPKEKAPLTEIKARAPGEYTRFVGNLVWKEFKKNGTQYWFAYGDQMLLEAMMSITGTVIIQEPRDAPGAEGEGGSTSVQDITSLAGNKLQMKDIIFGGEVEIYSCQADSELCMTAGKDGSGMRTVSLTGVSKQIRDILSGPMDDSGIIGKYARNSGDLTPTEKAFMGNLPGGLGALIRNLAVAHEESARTFVSQAQNVIAVTLVHHMITEIYRAARSSLASTDSAYKKMAEDQFTASYEAIRSEYMVLVNDYGNIAELMRDYMTFLQNVRKQRYLLATQHRTEQ